MADPKFDPNEALPQDQAAAAGAASEAAEPDSAAPAPDPFVVLQKLQQENTELKDKLLRTLAEMENLRRRTEKELADIKLYGISSFARDMLTFADNLQRLIANIPPELHSSSDAGAAALVEGLELTERDFLARLARFGVKKLDSQGAKFDPNRHEALFEVPDESVPSGTVVQVVEEGYAIGDRMLRPAKVGIARGGPKA